MTDSLGDILARRELPDEPPEIKKIKAYVRDIFDEDCRVQAREQSFVISVNSAPLAGALREHLHVLREELGTKKTLRIQITP